MEQQVNLYQPILGAEKRLFSALHHWRSGSAC